MFELKSNIVKKYDRSIPNVNFSDDETLWKLVDLIDVNMNIYQYLGLLFLRLGFEPEDNILLCNYDKDSSSFDCVLNNSGVYRIKFNKKDNQIIVKTNNIIYGYDCEKLQYGEIGMRVSLGSYTYEYADGMKFTRYLSRSKAKFEVFMGDDLVGLELVKPDDVNLPLYDEYGIYAKYKLNNEEDLVNYLSSSGVLCKSINDVYKELCEIYISNVSKYPEFVLKRVRLSEDGSLKVIDLIHLKYGELEKFGITKDNSNVFIDKDDNWSVELLSKTEYPVRFFMSNQDGKEMFSFSVLDNIRIKDYTKYGIGMDIDYAYEELTDISIKVKKMFNRGSK